MSLGQVHVRLNSVKMLLVNWRLVLPPRSVRTDWATSVKVLLWNVLEGYILHVTGNLLTFDLPLN